MNLFTFQRNPVYLLHIHKSPNSPTHAVYWHLNHLNSLLCRYPKDITESEMKRARQSESEGNEDRLSDLPDCVLLHILSFVKCKDAVQTCVLSTRWKHLWKHLPALVLHASDFRTLKIFSKFVSRLLSLHDGSVALHTLDFQRRGTIEPHILKRVLNYAISHNVQQLGIEVKAGVDPPLPSISSYTLHRSLKLPLFLLNWLKGLANVQSLTVTVNTLQVRFLILDLLKIKFPSLGNLKSLKVKMEPLSWDVTKSLGPANSRKEKMIQFSPTIPNGILDFLRQNSLSSEVTIIKW